MLEQQLVNGLMLGSVYALIAVAFTLAIGVLNFLNFSLPGLFMVAGMLTWYLLRAHIPWPIAALLAIASGGLLGLLVERFTYRLMVRSAHFVPLVTSMAFLILLGIVAIAAAERAELPLLATLQSDGKHPRLHFQDFRQEKKRGPKSIFVWVGPEGDFTPAEINATFSQTPISRTPGV